MKRKSNRKGRKEQNQKQVRQVIFDTIKAQKCLSVGIFCVVVGAVVAALIPPLILAKIIDTITAGHSASIVLILLYFGMLALTGIAESARESLLTVFGQKITHALRSNLLEKFIRLTADHVNQQEPGTLVSRFVGDVDTVENLFTSGIISMFADACKIVSILVVIWFQNRGLTFVLIVLLPFLFWFTRHVQKNMLAAQIENRKAVGRASGHVPETLHNIRTIHCLAKEKYMEERYDQYIGESYQAMEKTNFYDAVYSPVILILNAVVVAVVMLLSASGNQQILSLFGMSAGTAVAVINYISQIFTPVESLGMEIQTIQSAIAGIHRINEFFALDERRLNHEEIVETKDVLHLSEAGERKEVEQIDEKNKHGIHVEKTIEIDENYDANENYEMCENNKTHEKCKKKVTVESETPCVEFRNVTFGYDEQVVLNHVDFRVMDGEQVTLSGRTGAGKSTILKLLLGLYEPQKGAVLIHGKPAVDIQEKSRRRLFGYVEQSFHMVPGTVRDQITLYDDSISEEQVQAVARLTGLSEAIQELEQGFDTLCTSELFSQGQWQLLSIARAAVAEPSMLLLDEITANLDAETEKTVPHALKRVAENRTVISISHRTSAEMGRIIEV